MRTSTKQFAVFAALSLSTALLASAADSLVTFRVDMTYASTNAQGWFVPGSSAVFARGSFNNWSTGEFYDGTGSSQLTNNPSASGVATNLYTGTFHDTNDANGSTLQYKYYISGGGTDWESVNNRTATLPGTSGDSLTLPAVYFNDVTPPTTPPVTNDVTFQVDMSAQTLLGKFNPGSSFVYVRGGFNNWGGPDSPALTNNPAASNTNVYSGTVTISDQPNAPEFYKFYIDTGANWESPASTGGNNRSFHLLASSGPEVLPLVFFNDQAVSDLLSADTEVTFSVNMTNAIGTDSHTFDPINDHVYINGDWLGWWTWGVFPPGADELFAVGDSEVYTNTFLLPKGNGLSISYKYSINGPDNEAGFAANHFRFIRIVTNYSMPLDRFGNQLVEPSFGELKAGSAAASHVPVTWLGRPGVYLQTAASLHAPVLWTTLTNTGDGNWANGSSSANGFTFLTNYPAVGTKFFRLIKP